MNDADLSRGFFQGLFKLRDSLEVAAHTICAKIIRTNKSSKGINDKYVQAARVSPPSEFDHPSSDIWYAPPRNDCQKSIFPYYNQQLLASWSATAVNSKDEENNEEDSHGLFWEEGILLRILMIDSFILHYHSLNKSPALVFCS